MSRIATIAVLALLWGAATGNFSIPSLLLGAVVAGFVVLLLRDRLRSKGRAGRLLRIASLFALFLRELCLSAISVARWTIRPNLEARLAPAIIAFPLRLKRDAEITLLANMITLTPGTLTVDVSADRRTLFVHSLDCRDVGALKRSIAEGFERRIIEALG